MAAASSSSSIPQWNYDVFLSFKGEDTRKNFVDHLYMALRQKGIYTFKDDQKLERGKSISPELLKAISKSRIAVIVFSKNYTSSSWCLDELVEIIKCKNMMGLTVFPVFYDVDPSQVRKQKRSFAEAFGEHEETSGKDNEKLIRWRAALVEAANLSGWELKNIANGHEAEFIQKIVQETLKVLGHLPLNVTKYEVGIDSRVDEVVTLLDNDGLKDLRIVGICGTGGIGKTTIAKVVFNQILDQFESCHFLGNVREESKRHGLVYLQQQLLKGVLMGEDLDICHVDYGINVIKQRLCHKKILVILDDVDDVKQLKCLAGGKDWFGFGSRIIITTRDERLVVENKVDHVIYRAELFNNDEALQLFSWHAFSKNYPEENYLELSCAVINYAQGLPLALEVLGSFLYNRSREEWKCELNNLKKIPNNQIYDVLKISFDGLNDTERDLFLDIACFFKGYDKDYVMNILSSSEFHPRIAVLIERSLITISNGNKLWMHDLIEEMGKEIVRQEYPNDPGKRSRLWFPEDIYKVLEENTGTESIQGIMLERPHDDTLEELHVNADVFMKLKSLKFLKLSGIRSCGRITYLSNELRYFDWDGYSTSCLPSNFHPRSLVHLGLPHSQMKQISFPVKILEKLRFLNLSHSPYLNKTPDLSCLPCLENLDLRECTNLVEIQLFGGVHERLVDVNLNGCKKLRGLPRSIKLKNLKKFNLSFCSKLEKFPDIEGNMGCLEHLNFFRSAIKELPLSMEHLNGLRFLCLRDCRKLKIVPSNIFSRMKDLKSLEMGGTALKQLPSSIVDLSNLKILNLSDFQGTSSSLFPFSLFMGRRATVNSSYLQLELLSRLCTLNDLDLRNCNLSEEFFPNDISGLSSLRRLILNGNNFASVPPSFVQLTKLERLGLGNCRSLRTLTSLPSSIRFVDAGGCILLEWYWFPPSVGSPDNREFIFTECHKLVMSDKSLRSQLQVIGKMILPGSDIPHWFSHKSEGEITSVCLQVNDHNLPSYNDIKGIVVGAALECDGTSFDGIDLNIKVDGYSIITTSFENFYTSTDIGSDHIILIQTTEYFDEEEGVSIPIKNLMKTKPNLSPNNICQDQDGCYIEASIILTSESVKVRKLGIHLVMEEQADTSYKNSVSSIEFPESKPAKIRHSLQD
ncbi:disease resistance protein RUN1-like isoform X2 [Cornus florida]|uniref:disease resistance protein RUN1-like isoform X2 n=1 Tax=Cornus florida TaxID=4283 RepID=UPI0028A126D8|nr:disease resistance protein RUN1-like isoform X2 [Cornus florida]